MLGTLARFVPVVRQLVLPAVLTAVLSYSTMPAAQAAPAADEPALATLLGAISTAALLPVPMGFALDVEMSGLLGKWRFSGTVVRDAEGTHVTAARTPPFVTTDMLVDLVDFTKAMSRFVWKYTGKADLNKKDFHLLKGERRPGIYDGALTSSIWVDTETYLIYRLQCRYSWGTLDVEHTYAQQGGRMILTRQEARMNPLAMRMTVVYKDYWFKKQ